MVSRRWLPDVDGDDAHAEDGYLTEPYKVVSTVDTISGESVGQLTEQRPDAADAQQTCLPARSVAVGDDVLHLSYRYYWDDWSLDSHTVDLKYRHDVSDHSWIAAARALLRAERRRPSTPRASSRGAPLPAFASSDYRLGPLRTTTVGMTFGFRVAASAGEWTIRRRVHPPERSRAPAVTTKERSPEPGDDGKLAHDCRCGLGAVSCELPPLDILSLVVAYSRHF